MIISASPIPGNETLIAKTIDSLFMRGAQVYYSRVEMVHVHGHASQEELKMMLGLVRPRYFVPVHGEYRHLVAHASIARSMGVPASNTFVLTDGDVLQIDSSGADVVGSVPAGRLYVDGRMLWNMYSETLDERRRLSRNGVVAVLLCVDEVTGEALAEPAIVSSGFTDLDESQYLFGKTAKLALQSLETETRYAIDWDRVEARVAGAVSDFLYEQTRRRPTVLVAIERL